MWPFEEDYDYLNIILYVLVGLILLIILGIFHSKIKKSLKASKWKKLSKNSLIVHCVPRAKTLPNPSPFVMKLITYLKIAKVKYEVDYSDPFGPTGKTPWISYRGQSIGDSQLIIEFLNTELNINLNEGFTSKEIATTDSLRIMLEEHFFWGLALWRFKLGAAKDALKVMKLSKLYVKIVGIVIFRRSKAQGIGLHKKEDIIKIMLEDLRIVSDFLGQNEFLLGGRPCLNDAAVFGQLSEIMWGLPGSPYEEALYDLYPNLKSYCERIKTIYWKHDWESDSKTA